MNGLPKCGTLTQWDIQSWKGILKYAAVLMNMPRHSTEWYKPVTKRQTQYDFTISFSEQPKS